MRIDKEKKVKGEKVEKVVRKEENAATLEHGRSSEAFTANFQIKFSLCLLSASWALGWAGFSLKTPRLLANGGPSLGIFSTQAHLSVSFWLLAALPSAGT